ncbi:MAG TPA: VWA domain-containing protein [Candidatus Aquilonibacter sp.]|nr:VWA domain-containing protein [Candidatus Aquilonibacter sp.]
MRRTKLAASLLTVALAAIPAALVLSARATHGQDAPNAQDDQTNQEPPQTSSTLTVESRLVDVFATVRDKHNAILDNLTKDDFKVYEDGVPQKITYFAKESDMPITLAILMDTSYSMNNILGAEKAAASDFVHEIMRKKDEAVVISFDTDEDLLADFTEDPAVLTRAINRAQINVDASGIGGTVGTIPSQGGGTNLYDAVYLACHDELQDEAGRKAVIILSDAEDTGSKMSLDEAIEAAQRTDAVIHVILISDPSATEGYGYGVALQMARETGGRVIPVHNDKTLNKAFDEISEELRSQYVLGYTPSNTAHDGTFRKIKVETTEPDTKILSRRGYYAPNS